jgi:WD40 repeat protein
MSQTRIVGLVTRETGAVVKCEGTFAGHTGPVWSLTLTSDYSTLISGSSDTTVKVHDHQLPCFSYTNNTRY